MKHVKYGGNMKKYEGICRKYDEIYGKNEGNTTKYIGRRT